ncbi:MAG: hypothetical protein MO852_01615 [Candidatus Devosia euplotis]|nr:hypothetical protein [Candidatus Devosia euplotis]
MPNLLLALIAAGFWLGVYALALGLVGTLEPGLPQVALLTGLVLGALCGTVGIAIYLDRRAARGMAAIMVAAGLGDGTSEILSMGEIVARLGSRLERARQFKTAVSAIDQAVVLIDEREQIMAASAGATRLVRGRLTRCVVR